MLMNVPYFQNYAHNSRIILTKIATYYSQNYAGTLGSSLSIMIMSSSTMYVHLYLHRVFCLHIELFIMYVCLILSMWCKILNVFNATNSCCSCMHSTTTGMCTIFWNYFGIIGSKNNSDIYTHLIMIVYALIL